jgi:hypothetical protein
MKPFILKFAETPSQKSLDYSLVDYSKELNLSVLKNTNIPAVKFMTLTTETFTKTEGEDSDSDRSSLKNKLRSLLDTSTQTFTETEQSDTDKNRLERLRMLLDTTTLTESVENSDSDK